MTSPGRRLLSLGFCLGLVTCAAFLCSQSSPLPANEPHDNVPATDSHAPTAVDQGSGHLKQKVEPKYPERARQMRVQGQVVLQVVIDKKGKIKEMKLVSGHPLLAPAAMDAVKHWRYEPFRVAGRKVEVETEIVVNFQLEESGPR